MTEVPFANIRELLPVTGRTILFVSQHDEEDWLCGEPAFVSLHLDDGSTITFVFDDDCGRLFHDRSV